MTHRIGKVVYLTDEAPQQCDDCGQVKELRPYGPGGSMVCFECGMKDPNGTAERFAARVLDVTPRAGEGR